MGEAWFRFYAELNDFLTPDKRGKPLRRHFDVSGTAKDFIESFGVPHAEVDLVLINGQPAGFSQLLRDGDRVSVYPRFRVLDISAVSRVRPVVPRPFRFVLDVHLGRLAAYLRLAGFDSVYRNNASDPELAEIAAREQRVVLTRDRYLLMRSEVELGYWIRSTDSRQQLAEVLQHFGLIRSMQPFTRCMKCNAALADVSRESVLPQLPPAVTGKERFRRCPGCNRVYWEGSHHARMKKMLECVTADRGGIRLTE